MRKLIVLVLMVLVASCSTAPNGVRIVVLSDITEADFIARPKPEKIINQFGLSSDIWKSVFFSYSTISDISITRQYQDGIASEYSLLANELQRKKLVRTFVKDVDSVLRSANDISPRNYSSIWKPLVSNIIELQQDTITPTTVFLYSDLRENSRFWSSYRKGDTRRYDKDFDSVKQLFLDRATGIKRGTSNIKVVVVYQPRTPMDDIHYARMVRLYKALFSELEIPIEFVANL